MTNTDSWSVKMSDSVLRFYPTLSDRWIYHDGVVLKGIEQVWRMTGAPKYFEFIKEYIDTYVDEDGAIRGYRLDTYNIDNVNNGKLLFTVYQETGVVKYKKAADLLRSQLNDHPRTLEGGFWHKLLYPHQMWLDGLYMGAPFYAEYIQNYGDPAEFFDVVQQFRLVEKHLLDPQTGLYYHGWDERKQQKWADPETGCSPNFWSRAIGWFLMANVDVLDFLPLTHPGRARLINILNELVKAIIKYQDPATQIWFQVTDKIGRAGNYLEASASAMFIYAIAKAARQGYIDTRHRETAQKAFQGLLEKLVEVTPDGRVNLKQNCEVAGLGTPPHANPALIYRDGSFDYYIKEPIVTNDFKGVGSFILAAAELERKNEQT
jgi:unsaturated rhamnogalacturonyl hydrolase